jgi:hypothetical protein
MHLITYISFQRATEGIERAVYEKLIAPFKEDMPISHLYGFRSVCADRNYAFLGPQSFKIHSQKLSCKVVPLPETSYPITMALIISKNNHYRGIINWR